MNYLKSFIGWTHSYSFKIPCLHVESPEADYDVKRTEGRSLKNLDVNMSYQQIELNTAF